MSLQNAIEALKRKDFASARTLIECEDINSYAVQHFMIKGISEMALRDWGGARRTFLAATAKYPDQDAFWLNKGLAEENLKLIDDAILSQERSLGLNPLQGEACGNLSNLYRKQKLFTKAEEMARRALANGASESDALNCLGLALCKQGKFDVASDVFLKAHQVDPYNPAILGNLANLEIELLHFDEAWKLFAAARAISDNAIFRHDEGLARLLDGDFELGWKLFEARLELPGALRISPTCPRWQGEDLRGKKLLILAEQGLGDVIQFCRYQEFLPKENLVWALPKSLVRLMKGALRGTVLDETSVLPLCDYYVPMMSLPLASGHLKPEAGEFHPVLPQTPKLPTGKHKLKVGLIWAGSPTHERDHERSIKLRLLTPLTEKLAADFYAPFTGESLNEIGDLPILRLDALITDFADTAALLKQLDYLITVDTAAAHLAGALGIKTFLLLPYCPDWRWGRQGEATPWYPSLTLLRQKTYGDWQSAVEYLMRII